MAQNRLIFKQLFQTEAISYCQIDSCRIGGVNGKPSNTKQSQNLAEFWNLEILAVYFMAKKFGIPVCPHAGGNQHNFHFHFTSKKEKFKFEFL